MFLEELAGMSLGFVGYTRIYQANMSHMSI